MTPGEYERLVDAWARALLHVEHGEEECTQQRGSVYDWGNGMGTVTCGCGAVYEIGRPPPNKPNEPDRAPTVVEGAVMESGGSPDVVHAEDPIKATLALIDPTQFYSPADLQARILDVLARLERGALFERTTVEVAARAELNFKREYWRAHAAKVGGAADMRKAEAMVECEELHMAMVETEMVAKAAKATMHNLRSILSGYQSVSRSVLADYQAGGSDR